MTQKSTSTQKGRTQGRKGQINQIQNQSHLLKWQYPYYYTQTGDDLRQFVRKLPKLQHSWSSLRRKNAGMVQERPVLGSPSYAPNSASRVPISDVPTSKLSFLSSPHRSFPYLSQWPLLGLRLHLYTSSVSGESWSLFCFNLSFQFYVSSRLPNFSGPPFLVPRSVSFSVPATLIIKVPFRV